MATTEIANARIFDGEKLLEAKSIVIEDGLISSKTTGDIIVDGEGCTLLPGFIDSHIHLDSIKNLEDATNWGITTMLDMATDSKEIVDYLRNREGLTDIRSVYEPVAPAAHPHLMGMGFKDSKIYTIEDAENFAKKQIKQGADFVKLIIEDPKTSNTAFDFETIKRVVEVSHENGKKVFAHAPTTIAYEYAEKAGVDVINHIPFIGKLSDEVIKNIKDKNLISVPTIVMMEKIASNINKVTGREDIRLETAIENTAALKKAGVDILAGTDSNNDENSVSIVKHGESIHREFELLVRAGLTTTEVLKSTTSLPAKLLELDDRGVIKEGKRADLVMVEGDPTKDITATRNIEGVWIKGKRVR
ncbi:MULTISPECIES: amidohydrolase family protein [unclassified Clostridioides]|uniref:amidohydrolase family protein n=1 Tax=unclassified Clostridioides TaxID=2635829 RepID=UPI001D11939A|nr:amidohydrolase family protein [Clostridioides sp. ZZV14-6153]MCC0720133.1 amidohydrolase family protein [Clostridioides sp. ZZV14-6105]MCC0728009.1 amidohydrolase family protein [Clostridioides sp. ZZV14-6045]MCC0732495.1 amidohydrolase family protein [Clostridioides sp. ZZV14-6048]MCC0736287.1 amidohydrolase family protein [Clostridioides sp. ZZV14-6009]